MDYLIIGTSSITIRHLQNLLTLDRNARFEIVRSSKTGNPLLEQFQREHPGKSTISYHLEQSLRKKYEACILSNPTALHIPVALKVLPRVKGVFIEKPLSDSMKGVDRLVQLAKRLKKPVMVGYCLRFDPLIKAVKQILDSKALGKAYYARIEVGSYLPDWRSVDYRQTASGQKKLGGGVVLTLSHEIDYAYHFFGKPAKVTGTVAKVSDLDIDTEDLAEILLEYRTGMLCSIHLDYLQREHTREVMIIGENGTVKGDLNLASLETCMRTGKKQVKKTKSFAGIDKNQKYLDELSHFLECVKKKKETSIPLPEAKAVLEICLKAKSST